MTHLQSSFSFLAPVLRWCFNISTSFSFLMMLWSVSCNNNNNNMMLWPPFHNWDVFFCFYQLTSLPLFPPNITMVIMAKQLKFVSLDQRTSLLDVRFLFRCAVANRSLAFFMAVLAAFQVISIDFFYCAYRCFCTRFLQHLYYVLCCCSGIDLISRRQFRSPSWVVWWLCGDMVFVHVYCCLYRWTGYPQAFGNCIQEWTRLVESRTFFYESLEDFPWCQAKRH